MHNDNDDEEATHERLGGVLYRALRDRIQSGGLLPGARLSIPALADEFGVSRSPVRDAVGRLVQEGLATERLNHGAVIARVEGETLSSLYAAREGLESVATRLATMRKHDRLAQDLWTILGDHEKAVADGDFARHMKLDMAFHAKIRAASQSPVLERMLDEIQGQVTLAMRSTSISGGMVNALRDHRKIAEAITAGDVKGAEEAAGAHIRRLAELLA